MQTQTRHLHWTFLTLLVLLAATVMIHEGLQGWISMSLSLIIALAKALLVLWIFMQLKVSPKSVRWFLGGTLFLAYIAIILSLSDYLTRSGM